MLGTKANTNMNRIKKNKENKFKPEDIITNLKTPTWYFRPVQEWIDNINMNSATWKVISVDDKNGDYTLQRLDTLTKSPLLADDGPIYQKQMKFNQHQKVNQDNYHIICFSNYRLLEDFLHWIISIYVRQGQGLLKYL